MKIIKKITVAILIVFVVIQFIPTKRNQSTVVMSTDFTNTFNVPDSILSLLKSSCYDCHSNNTNYPWYNHIQPVAWMLSEHVNDGKKELNFSEFGSYSKRKQKHKLKAIISQVKKEEMPIYAYTIIHRDAVLSSSEQQQLFRWIERVNK